MEIDADSEECDEEKKMTSYLKVLFKDYARSILRSLKDKHLADGITKYIPDIVTAELKCHVLHSFFFFLQKYH